MRKAASATVPDTQNDERVGEVPVVNGATYPDETENNFEHKTENGCEEAENGCDAKARLEKSESCESREQKTTVASNRDTGASKPTKDAEKQDIVEQQALVSRS